MSCSIAVSSESVSPSSSKSPPVSAYSIVSSAGMAGLNVRPARLELEVDLLRVDDPHGDENRVTDGEQAAVGAGEEAPGVHAEAADTPRRVRRRSSAK